MSFDLIKILLGLVLYHIGLSHNGLCSVTVVCVTHASDIMSQNSVLVWLEKLVIRVKY